MNTEKLDWDKWYKEMEKYFGGIYFPKTYYTTPCFPNNLTGDSTMNSKVTTSTKTTKVHSITAPSGQPYSLEEHQDGSFVLVGLKNDKGEAVTSKVYNKDHLKLLYKLLGEVVVS